jgi:DNA uptake protein ComE-like DNA-binding protein
MNQPPTTNESSASNELFQVRRRDQLLLALIALGGLALILGYYFWRIAQGQSWLHLDDAERKRSDIMVNINTATEQELMLLPEIGRKTAPVIIEDRQAKGPFRSPQDFKDRIKGIGDVTLKKLTPFLTGWTDETPQK